MVECFNKIFVMMFSVYVNDYYFDWDRFLFYVMMVYRLLVYEIIGFILNFMMFGREVIILLDIMYEMLMEVKYILSNKWVW